MIVLTKEEAKVEVSHFIDETLREFVTRTPRIDMAPIWKWSPQWPFVFYVPDLILVPELVVVPSWMYDRDSTVRCMRFSLAHEYAHYLQYRTRPRLWGKWGSEILADIQATRLTGITPRENQVLWGKLISGLLGTKELRSPISVEEFRRRFEYEVVATPGFMALPMETQSAAVEEFLREYEAHPRKEFFTLLGGKVWAKFDVYPWGRVLTFLLPEEW